jgi:TonB family protein
MRKYFLIILFFTSALLTLQAQSNQFHKRKGTVTTKYSNGTVESKGKVKNQLKTGEWNYWNEDGKLIKTENYKNNNNKCFSNAVLNGSYVTYYANGQIDSIGNFSNGKQIGVWQGWNEKGNLVKYISIDSVRHETYYAYSETGKRKQVTRKTNGLFDGLQVTYNKSPQYGFDSLTTTVEYKMGRLYGYTTHYFLGIKISEIPFANDVKEGKYITRDQAGNLQQISYWKNGKQDSLELDYDNGKIIKEEPWKNGLRDGTSKYYYRDNGRPEYITWYKNGVIDSAITYFENGAVASHRYLLNEKDKTSKAIIDFGKATCPQFTDTSRVLLPMHFWKITDYDSLNRKTREYYSSDSEMFGTYLEFYTNGKICTQYDYQCDHNSYHFKKFYTNGKLMIETDIVEMEILTDPKLFDQNGNKILTSDSRYEKLVRENIPEHIEIKTKAIKNSVIPDNNPNEIDPAPMYPTSPEFPGGTEALNNFLTANIHYPEALKKSGISGIVYVRFAVEKDGSIAEISVVKEVQGAPEFTQEAIRVFQMMPRWTPGNLNGRPVRVQLTQPVKFVLQ